MIERITDNGVLLAILVRADDGPVSFSSLRPIHNYVTEPDSPLQLGMNVYRAGQRMEEHIHLPRKSLIERTQEFVYVKSGHVQLILPETDPITTRDLYEGDCLLLVSGVHGFEVISDSVLINVKQGPYDATADKVLLKAEVNY